MNQSPNNTGATRTEIVVPTLAETQRAPQLMRAIDSILREGGRALVVINGTRFDPAVKSQLESLQGIRLLCIAEAGLPNALHVGRCAVSGEYFGFLDDDDYLLARSIALRESFLDAHPRFDAVVTNGLREEWKDDRRLFKGAADLDRIARDPLAALMQANWMTPCGALYRTATVPSELFLGLTRYTEWTDVAFRLTQGYQFGFVLEHTFVQSDTPGSLSKHANQARFTLELHQRMAGRFKTRRQRRLWDQRVCTLHHRIAEEELAANNRSDALRHHLRSLLHAPSIGLPRYFLFSRKFLFGQAK